MGRKSNKDNVIIVIAPINWSRSKDSLLFIGRGALNVLRLMVAAR